MRSSVIFNSLILFMILFSPNEIVAESKKPAQDWDFSGKFQPYWDTLWHFDGQFFELSCEDKNDVMYENYAKLHPQFRPLMADKQMRKNWRYSLITKGDDGIDSFNSCFYLELLQRWWEVSGSDEKGAVLFCGKMAEELNKAEQDGVVAIAEFAEYALMGRSTPVTQLLTSNLRKNRMRLNKDIYYYLQLNLQKLMAEKPSLPALTEIYKRFVDPQAGINLTRKRRKYLDEAFSRGDHMSVIDTTAPCQSA